MEDIKNVESENNQLKSYLNDYKDNNQKLSQDNQKKSATEKSGCKC